MSYLNLPQLHFFGKFRADPNTIDNTPDNFNPNAQFPPANGGEVSNNIQLYWNPNGTGQFSLDCTVTKICYADGTEATTSEEDPLIGQQVASLDDTPFKSGKVVDLDPMQQNVTEIWGLRVRVGDSSCPLLEGDYKPSAYSNAWVQVDGGMGDFAGSANFQSVLDLVKFPQANASRFIRELRAALGDSAKLSINFVLRSFNPASPQYLINTQTLAVMKLHGVSDAAIAALLPLSQLSQNALGSQGNVPGLIPTTSYFQKLVAERLENLNVPCDQVAKILAAALQPDGPPPTAYDFTYGQALGTIGLADLPPSAVAPSGLGPAPDLLAPDRMLAPLEIQFTPPPAPSVPTVSGPYPAYFAPFKVSQYRPAGERGAARTILTLNLGNSLLSSQPASPTESNVETATYGETLGLWLIDSTGRPGKLLARISYADQSFYSAGSGIVNIPIDDADVDAVQAQPLGLAYLCDDGTAGTVFLQENALGLYVRPEQFVFRMNPGVEPTPAGCAPSGAAGPLGQLNPGKVTARFYVSRFGQPAKGVTLVVKLMPPLETQTYSNSTLGTGGTSGMVNMGVPESAVILQNGGVITTDAHGIASLEITAQNPGNPRGYVDGQIYFLQYGFQDPASQQSYIQSADDLISLHVYDQQPEIEDVTWANFVGPILKQYAKIYPVMSFLTLGDEESVKNNAGKIRQVLVSNPKGGGYMPVTRDLSASRLSLIVRWLDQFIPKK